MEHAIRKAETLIEALSYIRKFRDRLTVIKLGGSAMEDAEALTATLQDVIFMETVGLRPILVHGGGKPIDRAMAKAGLKPRKVQGRRYTDERTLEIVVHVLLKEINADIIRQIKRLGGRAVGLHTDSLQALHGRKLMLTSDSGEPVDLGRVGEVSRVDRDLIEDICKADTVPVIPSLALDDAGGWLNINADTAAAVAAHVQADKLVFLTETPGILRHRTDESSVISSLDAADCQELIRGGVIDSGMIPKVEACLDSLRAGVKKTHMIDGRLRHSLLLEIFTDTGVGTEITLKKDQIPGPSDHQLSRP
jgi:acetylglutamate kinase